MKQREANLKCFQMAIDNGFWYRVKESGVIFKKFEIEEVPYEYPICLNILTSVDFSITTAYLNPNRTITYKQYWLANSLPYMVLQQDVINSELPTPYTREILKDSIDRACEEFTHYALREIGLNFTEQRNFEQVEKGVLNALRVMEV